MIQKIKTFFKELDKDSKIMCLLGAAEILLMIIGWFIPDTTIRVWLLWGQITLLIPMFILTRNAYKEWKRINKQYKKILEDNEKDK